MLEGFSRKGPFADKPGSYQLLMRINNSVFDPGESIHLDTHISGYGFFNFGKITFYPAENVFDFDNSSCTYGVGLDKSDELKLLLGTDKISFSQSGVTIKLNIQMKVVDEATQEIISNNIPVVFDSSNVRKFDCPQVLTETDHHGKTILDVNLRLRDGIKPGCYALKFCLSYYNGEKWETSTQEVSFTVRDYFQRNENKIANIGAIAAAATILSFVWQVFPVWLATTATVLTVLMSIWWFFRARNP